LKLIAHLIAGALLAAGVAGVSTSVSFAAKGQDFPETTCTCQKCGPNKGDVTGQCGAVCKDKTIYSKGSEPHDYCKASAKVRAVTGVKPLGKPATLRSTAQP